MPAERGSNIVFCLSLIFFQAVAKQYYREVPEHHKAALFTLVKKAMGAEYLIGMTDNQY